MIRYELKNDPIGFISKHLEGVDLSKIEQLYIIIKCPNLFNFINDPSKLVQRIYVRKTTPNNLSISNIRDRVAFIRAIKKNPRLCLSLDMIEFEKEVSMCIDSLYADNDIDSLKTLIVDPYITNGLLRKIIFLVPRLIEYAIDRGFETFDEDIELFIYTNNPMLIRKFKSLSKNTVEYILRDNLSNVVFMEKWLYMVSDEFLLDIITSDLLKRAQIYKYNHVHIIIDRRPHLFSEIIKILYKNGFNKKTDFTTRFLLKEFNELIDDQLASFLIENDEK